MNFTWVEYALVFIRHKYEDDLQIEVIKDPSRVLETEVDHVGASFHWFEDIGIPRSGFYKIEYQWQREQEWCDGHLLSAYPVITHFVDIKFSFKAMLLYVWLKLKGLVGLR